jgi:SAM-dependent methyltransferase
MDRFEKREYGERIAGVYDTYYSSVADGMIDTLAGLAHNGPALELGIGTGRVALPLQERGVAVHGIDASEAMVARLRAKEGGERLPVTMGDFAAVPVEGEYPLIYVVFNTFFNLLSQEEQVRCFANVARHLRPAGCFLIEVFVPDLQRFDRGQSVRLIDLAADEVRLDISRHDPQQQQVSAQHVVLATDGIRLYPIKLRYAWPSELDLMARLAGLSLRERRGGWLHEPFTGESGRHISVYERPA